MMYRRIKRIWNIFKTKIIGIKSGKHSLVEDPIQIDNCKGNGQIGDVNAVVSMFGGNILDVETDITPGVDIEIDEVEVISNEK